MAISKLLLKTAALGLDAIFKASDADIRPHGLDHLPRQPILYVVNHFTRLETMFLPYIIEKHTGVYPLSLAHYSFFGGKFGKFLDKLGVVSTKDPERDKIFIRALLTGDYHAIIFPEGQMVKDKKIIEKGKYFVYNMGIRRPPHRGAAVIALQTQLYREKIRKCHADGDMEGLAAYQAFFDLSQKDVERIIAHDTVIVPVNITYFPVRAKNNAVKRMVERFLGPMSDRFEEEIEVEGTMLSEGVDIDVNFGEPINMDEYFQENRKLQKLADNGITYLERDDIKKARPFKKIDARLTQRYMDSIYKMTTVNHDHIFSYILSRMHRDRISEMDFKNRAFLALERIRRLNISNYHTSIDRKQFYLLTDDEHAHYKSFIEAAVAEKLLFVKNGIITINRDKLKKPYQFHLMRKLNIIEVLKNEIEPLPEVVKTLNRLMRPFPCTIRRRIRNHFINLELDLFNRDYRRFYVPGESKPEHIGRPQLMRRFFRNRGVILVHGYMAAPEEMRVLAEALHRAGYNVYLSRLRGHGTSPDDLAGIRWEKWYDSVSRAYIIMKNRVKKMAIIGFSTGAGLALLQASQSGKNYSGVVSISAPLRLQNIASRFSSAVVLWNSLLKKIHLKKGAMDFVQNDPENPHINYLRNPVSGVNELSKLMKVVEDRLRDLDIPALIIQGSEDPVVNPESAEEIFAKIGTDDKDLVRVVSRRHGIVRGEESAQVIRLVLDFLDNVFSRR